MASPLAAALCALVALAFFGAVGLPIARRLFDDRSFALAISPTLGWALFSAAALPILCVIGFDGLRVSGLAVAALVASLAVHRRDRRQRAVWSGACVPGLAYALAAVLATVIAFTLLPKMTSGGVELAGPIFDHSKVAIVDEIVRNGLPAQNPFYGGAGTPSGLAYYYLWHFSAATFALPPGVSAWEADVGLTWFTAFSIIALMMGLAVRVSDRSRAAYWTLPLCLAASSRWLFDGLFGGSAVKAWLSAQPVPSFIEHVIWAPQHGAAAACVLVCAFLIDRLSRRGDWLSVLCLGLVAAAGFGASVWIGGFVFALTAVAAGALVLWTSTGRVAFIMKATAAAAIAVVAASPLIVEQFRAAAVRPEGLPVAFRPQDVLGPAFGDWARGPVDLVAFWLVQLPYDLPAIYPAGALFLGLAAFISEGERRRLARLCALVALASFGVASAFASTVLNNDLGWRAVLPGVLVVTAYAAGGMASWTIRPPRVAALAQAALVVLGLGGGAAFARHWMTAFPSSSAAEFARSPELWRAVRNVSSETDRVANNPLLFADVTPWPINISWALFADRRSCYAAWEFARPFAPIPLEAANAMERRFREVFAGSSPPDETYRLLAAHGCRVVVLTALDGAWAADPFANDPKFRLLEERRDRWRIYRLENVPAE